MTAENDKKLFEQNLLPYLKEVAKDFIKNVGEYDCDLKLFTEMTTYGLNVKSYVYKSSYVFTTDSSFGNISYTSDFEKFKKEVNKVFEKGCYNYFKVIEREKFKEIIELTKEYNKMFGIENSKRRQSFIKLFGEDEFKLLLEVFKDN